MTEPIQPSRARTLLFVALVAFGPMSIDLYLPSLPAIVRALDTTVSGAQLTLSVYTAVIAVGQLVYGPLSDRFGRRPVLLAGLSLYLLGGLLCLAATDIATLIAFRAVQAMGASAGPVLARAAVRDLYSREQAARMLSVLAAAMSVAPAVAPILGGWLVVFGWRANFVVMVVFGVTVIAAAWFVMTETNRRLDARALQLTRMAEVARMLARDRVFAGNLACVASVFASIFAFLSISSFVLIDALGVAPQHFGYYFAATSLFFMSGSTVSARLGHRIGLERMIRFGTALGCVAGAAMVALALARVETVAAVVVPMMGITFSIGLVLPNCTATALAPHPGVAGMASALLGAAQMGAGALAGWIVGLLHDGTTLPLAAFMMGGWWLAGLVQLTVLRPRRT